MYNKKLTAFRRIKLRRVCLFLCGELSHFIVVRINSVMTGIGAFNKQLEFILIGIGIKLVSDLKNPNRALCQVAIIQSVVPYIIKSIQLAGIIVEILGQSILLFYDIPILICTHIVLFAFRYTEPSGIPALEIGKIHFSICLECRLIRTDLRKRISVIIPGVA